MPLSPESSPIHHRTRCDIHLERNYYAVALIAYMAKGVDAFGKEDHVVDIVIALIAPLVILTIFLLVSRIRHRFIRETETAVHRSDKGQAARAMIDNEKGL